MHDAVKGRYVTGAVQSLRAAPDARLRAELLRSTRELSARGLVTGAKWTAELLASLPHDDGDSDGGGGGGGGDESNRVGSVDSRTMTTTPAAPAAGVDGAATAPAAAAGAAGNGTQQCVPAPSPAPFASVFEETQHLCGKSLFDAREYRRCAHALERASDARSRFLRWYALYLQGEKRKEEETFEVGIGAAVGMRKARNAELPRVRDALVTETSGGAVGAHDPYLWMLLGVAHKQADDAEAAVKCLAHSLALQPVNWSAWLELAEVFDEKRASGPLDMSAMGGGAWMLAFFLAQVMCDLQDNDMSLQLYDELLQRFPRSPYLLSQVAHVRFNMRDFDEAELVFQAARRADPYRLEGTDLFSNILFVKERRSELSLLASQCVGIDKYRAESCCVIGNYYALRQQHEKAVQYFRRALNLNRNYLAAWTLMGHEFLEMKNTSAAVEAYRRAIDINPRDYRPWYGLGQTYELLQMPHYSLYYFKRAAALRPNDDRMWSAMGQCYQELGRRGDALRCYERALASESTDTRSLRRIAELCRMMGDHGRAAACYEQLLSHRAADAPLDADQADAVLHLARFCIARGTLQDAQQYCLMLHDFPGNQQQEANRLLRTEISPALERSPVPDVAGGWSA